MDKAIHRCRSLDAMKADEYRAWQKLQPHERLASAAELSIGAYCFKAPSKNVPARLQRTLVRVQQPEDYAFQVYRLREVDQTAFRRHIENALSMKRGS